MARSERCYMDIAAFKDLGHVQELNRLFLHPLGLALEVKRESLPWYARLWLRFRRLLARLAHRPVQEADDETGEWGPWTLGGIWDYRDDPEGVTFGGDYLDTNEAKKKAAFIAREQSIRAEKRQERLGFNVQPMEKG